jgi:hypothetical protein
MNVDSEEVQRLLQLANVPPSDATAASWLAAAIEGARSNYRAAKQRVLAADRNDLLADVEKSANELIKRIQRLKRQPLSQRAFWHSRAFGPVYGDRVEIREILSVLDKIVRAADGAKDRRKGRPSEVGKQHVTNLAFGFFVKFSTYRPSGTPTGPFAKFAHGFYAAVTNVSAEKDGGLDRQIRQAMKRSPVQKPAQRKSVKNLRVSS